jgi:hypothetical protein
VSPVIFGGIVALLNCKLVGKYDDMCNNWLSRKKVNLATKEGKVSRFFFKPLVWSLLRISQWTESISHQGLRSGARFACYIYIVGVASFIAAVSISIVVLIVIALLMLWLVMLILGSGSMGDSNDSSTGESNEWSGGGDKKSDPETGERIIKQDGKTYRQTGWNGKWVADTDWIGKPITETDWAGKPVVETDWAGKQKIETDWAGKPIIPPD